MKVCFVYPDIGGVEHYGTRKFYHGIGYLSAVLKEAGHETALMYLTQEPARDDFVQQIAALSPQVVAFSSTTHQHPYVTICAAWLKEALPELFLVSGGIHPTLAPEEVVADENLDAVCVGEGEHVLLDLTNALAGGRSYRHIENLWVRDRQTGEIIRNGLRPLLTNLDMLPFPDRELFGYEQILAQNGYQADMLAGRGCPYNCSYCCNPALKARYRGLGKYVRFRGVENVLAEIRHLQQRYTIRSLNFQDDTFTLDERWTAEFCRAYKASFQLPFWINTRVERLDEETVRLLAEAGCQGVRIGVESGNEWLRSKILKRQMSNDDLRHAFRLLHQYGLQAYTCNMIGVPGETAEMIAETIELNRELSPTKFQYSVFYPYPMTELYDVSVREGYLRDEGSASLHGYYERESVLHLPTLSAAELAEGYDRFAELRHELQLKQQSPWKYRLYRAAVVLRGGDALKARRQIDALRRWLPLRRGKRAASTETGSGAE